MKLAPDKLLLEIEDRIADSISEYSEQKAHSESEQLYWSGEQFTKLQVSERQQNMRPPLISYNICKTYVHAIVNPLRQSPNGIIPTAVDPEVTSKLRDIVRGVENNSNADEAYETLFENMVVGGRGFVGVTTDYSDDESEDQVVKIVAIPNTSAVLYDPNSVAIDGSDAEWCMVCDFMSEDLAEQKYGEDVCNKATLVEQYRHMTVPDESIPVLTYYFKKYKQVKRWFFADGSYLDQKEKPLIDYTSSRTIQKVSVKVIKLIGDYIIEETELATKLIPIIPGYGEANRDGTKVKWVGLIDSLKPLQDGINTYWNSEMEMIDLMPLSPFIGTAKQIKGQERYWNRANKTAFPVLIHNHDELAPGAPQRVNNMVNTQSIIGGRQAVMQDLGRATGIADAQLNEQTMGDQSGTALIERSVNSEKQTAHFYQNLEKSMKAVGNVVIELIFATNEGMKEIELVNENGESSIEEVNFEVLKDNAKKLKVEVSVGAKLKSARDREIIAIGMLQGALPPEKQNAFIDFIAESSVDSKNKAKIMERVKKLLPIEFQEVAEGAIDPMAEQALQSAQQAIQAEEQKSQALQEQIGLMGEYIKQQQQQIFELQSDSKSMLLKAQMDNQTKLLQEAMKQEGMDKRQIMDMIDTQNQTVSKQIHDLTISLKKDSKPLEEISELGDNNITKGDVPGRQFSE